MARGAHARRNWPRTWQGIACLVTVSLLAAGGAALKSSPSVSSNAATSAPTSTSIARSAPRRRPQASVVRAASRTEVAHPSRRTVAKANFAASPAVRNAPGVASAPTTPFTQCPAVGADASCAILIQVTDTDTKIFDDPSQGPFDGIEDTLVGIVNDSSHPLTNIALSSDTDMFGFDGDGLCAFGVAGCPFGPTGYEGPNTSFSNITPDTSGGVVNLTGGLAPGASTYFSLEERLSASTVIAGGPGIAEQGGPPNASEHFTTCSVGSPVNCATGVFWHDFQDFVIPGRGVQLDLGRTYSSNNATTDGPFGFGWTHSYNRTLTLDGSGNATVHQENGAAVTFNTNGAGGFSAPPRVLATLTANGDGTYTFIRDADSIAQVFSATGQLVSEADRNGYATTLSYTGNELASVSDSAGRKVTFTYAGSHISQVSDPLGRTIAFSYDGNGNLSSTTDPLGRVTTFTYDASHLMTGTTDPRGGSTSNTYDSLGRVTRQVDAAGRATTWSYSGDPASAAGGSTTSVDSHSNATVYSYANLELLSVTHGSGGPISATTGYSYDPSTLGVTSITDPNGHTTTKTYDRQGNQLSSTDPLGNTTSYTFNSFNEVVTNTSPLDETTIFSYDANGNLTQIVDPLGNATSYDYADAAHPGDLTSSTDPDGRVTTSTYNAQGDRASTSLTPSVGVTETSHFVYDADGERVCAASPNAIASGADCGLAGAPRNPRTTTMVYDADRELLSLTDPQDHATTYAYDPDGNRTNVTASNGHVTTTTYDALDRPVSVTTGAGGTAPSATTSAYDLAPGSGACDPSVSAGTYCSTTTDPNGQVTVDFYNSHDKVVQENRPGGQSIRFNFDSADNKVAEVDASGGTTQNAYDDANRLIGITFSDGTTPSVTYAYDADGHRISMHDGTGTTSYGYDADGRLTATTDGNGSTVSYAFDGAGNLTSLTYPDGRVVTRTYDGASRFVATNDGSGHTTDFAYDGDGNLTTTTYPNGDTVSSTYTPAGHMSGTQVAPTASLNTPLAGVAYSRDAAGLATQVAEAGGLSSTNNYSYDQRDQLASVNGANFAYDATGNPTGLADGTVQTFNPAHELTSSTNGALTNSFSYDARGNRTVAQRASGETDTFAYDQANRLVESNAQASNPSLQQAYAPAVLADHPYGYWRLGEATGPAAVDSSGNGRDGAYGGFGLAGPTLGRPGLIAEDPDTAADFSPANLVSLPTAPITKASFSLEAWIRPAPLDGDDELILSVVDSNVDTQLSLKVSPQGAVLLHVRNGHVRPALRTLATPANTVEANQISHVVVTYDQTRKTARIYVNGQLKATGILSQVLGGASALLVGSKVLSSNGSFEGRRSFTGTIDEVAIYTSILSAEQIIAHDQAGSPTSTALSYRYNGDGLRQVKEVGANSERFEWGSDASGPILLADGGTDFVFGPMQLPIEQTNSSETSYFFHDAIGTTRALLSSVGDIAATFTYDSYGRLIGSTGTAKTSVHFAGSFLDAETGFNYLVNRYYDPQSAQFLTVDPALSLTKTPYGYSANSPTNYVDPLGLDWYNPFTWTADTWSNVAAGVGIASAAVLLCVATACIGDVAVAAGATTLAETYAVAQTAGDIASLVGLGAAGVSGVADTVKAWNACSGSFSADCAWAAGGVALDIATFGIGGLITRYGPWQSIYGIVSGVATWGYGQLVRHESPHLVCP